MKQSIIIYHTNDMHARISTTDDDNLAIGLDKISKIINLTKLNNINTFWFDGGDLLHGTPAINISTGDNMVKLLNPSKLNAAVAGNHDFNYGIDRLNELSKKLHPYILSANTVYKDTHEHVLLPYIIYNIDLNHDDKLEENSNNSQQDNIKIGVFGLTTPETAYKTNPNNVKDIEFLDPIIIAKQMVNLLSKTCDIIIALTHLGLDESSKFTSKKLAEEVNDIDLIIDGHSHTMLMSGITINNTLIVQTGWHDHMLGKVTLTFDNNKLINKKAELLDEATIDKLIGNTDKYISNILTNIEDDTNKILNKYIYTNNHKFSGDRLLVRRQESELGNFITTILRRITKTHIAFINGGDLRADLLEGDITYKDILAIFPFETIIKAANIPGKLIKEMLEHSVEYVPASFGGFINIDGMTFSFNPNLPPLHRISNIIVGNELLNEDKIYTVTLTDFMTVGGDGYSMIKDVEIIKDVGILSELIANYLQTDFEPIDYSIGRIKVLG